MLGPHDERPPAEGQVLAVDPLLELAGREDPRGPRARDQAGGPRALPGPGGQHHGACVHFEQPLGAGHLGPAWGRPAGHHGAGPDVDARWRRPARPSGGRRPDRSGPGRRSRRPNPVCSHRRGVPPASSSRSRPRRARRRRPSARSPRPGRPGRRRRPGRRPARRCGSSGHSRVRQPGGDGRAAEEPLTAPVGGPGAAAHAAEVHGGDRGERARRALRPR